MIVGAHDFARQVMASVESPGDLHIKNALLKYIMAFPIVLKVLIVLMFVGFPSKFVFFH